MPFWTRAGRSRSEEKQASHESPTFHRFDKCVEHSRLDRGRQQKTLARDSSQATQSSLARSKSGSTRLVVLGTAAAFFSVLR